MTNRAQTHHIEACRNAWIKHHESCRACTDWIDNGLYLPTPCEQGRVLYDEYCQAIEANRDTEHLTATEADK